jgi:polyisoprenoid-binding protein YceI
MSVTEIPLSATGLPIGTWRLDPVHSSASFAVKHMAVATFRGRFERLGATLTVDDDSAELVGNVDAGSIVVKDENLQAHLGSPDFFDIERYPEITFRSTSIRRDGDEVIVDGQLTIKGNTRAVEARGTIAGPGVTLAGAVATGIQLETIIDRGEFGLNFNAPLPTGGVAVANEVKLTVELELVKD